MTSGLLLGQRPTIPQHLATYRVPAEITPKTGAEIAENQGEPYSLDQTVDFRTDPEVILGTTTYDLQSNAAHCNRISMRPDGRLAATWIQGFTVPGFYPDRGAGYNTRLDFAWQIQPTQRVESERTGWVNHVFTASGAEVMVAHTFETNRLLVSRRNLPTDAWTEAYIPTDVEVGLLWPRMTVGGPNGETIHVIAITTPSTGDLGGDLYEGVNGHILYFRSTDGGANWDRTDIAIEGLGSEFTIGSSSDAYYIDARGETVAFAVFNDWDDVLYFKSTDNGDTWNKTIVNDFPLEKYAINSGYTLAELPEPVENQPNPWAMLTSDNFGSLVLDHDGNGHVFYGQMWVQDSTLDDQNTFTFYPFTQGMSYWNESMGEDNATTLDAVFVPDFNDNELIDIPEGEDIGNYGSSLTTMPSVGVDEDGNLYLAYSVVVENKQAPASDGGQFYRHVYIISGRSMGDGGYDWSEPYNIITPEIISVPDLSDFVEAVYPIVVRDVDNFVRLIYMQDFQPGIAIAGDTDVETTNYINYVQVPVSEFGVVRTEEPVTPETFGLKLAPSITNSQTTAQFELANPADVQWQLLNAHGQVVANLGQQQLIAGQHQQMVDVSTYPRGVYYLMMRVDNQFTVMELIKQ